MRHGFLCTALVAALVAVAACSRTEPQQLIGHWRAERQKVLSINLPIGPEFEVREHELVPLGAGVAIPISSLSSKDNEVTAELPAGIGLSFYFEGLDRMYVDVPLVGKLYYQRVKAPEALAAAAPAMTPTPARASSAPAAAASVPPTPAEPARQTAPQGTADYDIAILMMRQANPDAAVRSLGDAFAHGFRDFGKLEASVELAPLRADVRYQALLARYR